MGTNFGRFLDILSESDRRERSDRRESESDLESNRRETEGASLRLLRLLSADDDHEMPLSALLKSSGLGLEAFAGAFGSIRKAGFVTVKRENDDEVAGLTEVGAKVANLEA